eukprot:6152671-Pleurochrysis_carterae.AAC.1
MPQITLRRAWTVSGKPSPACAPPSPPRAPRPSPTSVGAPPPCPPAPSRTPPTVPSARPPRTRTRPRRRRRSRPWWPGGRLAPMARSKSAAVRWAPPRSPPAPGWPHPTRHASQSASAAPPHASCSHSSPPRQPAGGLPPSAREGARLPPAHLSPHLRLRPHGRHRCEEKRALPLGQLRRPEAAMKLKPSDVTVSPTSTLAGAACSPSSAKARTVSCAWTSTRLDAGGRVPVRHPPPGCARGRSSRRPLPGAASRRP